MTKFLIQTFDGQIKHDFSFHLIEAINYNNWFYNETIYEYKLSDTILSDDYIPIGSLDFVFQYIKEEYDINSVQPINVPKELMIYQFLKRIALLLDKNQIQFPKPMFVKSATKYKNFTDVISDVAYIPEDKYFVSEVIDIESEWRAFVQHKQLVGLQNYSGDFTLFPNVDKIKEMIKVYEKCPDSYTLDVGVNETVTFVIEVHPFVSCGLYGFNDYKRLPQMCIEGFKYFIN